MFGYGRVDALAAVQGAGGATPTPTAIVSATSTPVGPTPTGCPVQNVVLDPSFEAGSPNPSWDEGSTNFGTPLCIVDICGDGGGTAGPRTGDWWAWFGGIADVEDAFVSQPVNIPAGSQATLQFYLWIGTHSGAGAADYLRVTVDGTEVFRADDTSTEYDAGYTLVSINVTNLGGGAKELRFEEHNEASGNESNVNFHVDDVSLEAGGCPPPGAQQSHRPLKSKPGRSSQHRMSHSKLKAPYPLLAPSRPTRAVASPFDPSGPRPNSGQKLPIRNRLGVVYHFDTEEVSLGIHCAKPQLSLWDC